MFSVPICIDSGVAEYEPGFASWTVGISAPGANSWLNVEENKY